MGNKVNLFIIGAPKCGTTSLANYLGMNDEIFLSSIKEPHYFKGSLEGPYTNYVDSLLDYEALYDEGKDSKYRLDASVWYYISKESAEQILAYNPNAKVILMVRNPLQAIVSLYKHRRAALNEDQEDINEAIRLSKERKEGKSIPIGLRSTKQGLYYIDNYAYWQYVEQYSKLFGENFKVIVFDDLVINPEKVVSSLCGWLGIENSKFDSKVMYNSAKPNRSVAVTRFLHLISPNLKQGLKKVPGLMDLSSKLFTLFPKKELVTELNQESLALMRMRLNQSTSRLESYLKRDLKNWKV